MMKNSGLIPSTGVSVRAGVEAIFRQRRLFAIVVGVALGATAALTLLTPKQYLSQTKFLVQNSRTNVVVTPQRTTAPNVVSGVTEEQVNSEIEILHSRDVLDPIADPGWKDLKPAERTEEANLQHEKILKGFEKRLMTSIVRQTDVIEVSLMADTPELARDQLRKVSAAYLEKRRNLQRPQGSSEFFGAEAERIRNGWDAANQQLVNFQKEHQLLSLPDREEELNTMISEGEQDLLTADVNEKEISSRLEESSKQLQNLPARRDTEDKVVPHYQSLEQLNTLLVELMNSRSQLLTKYQPNDRLVLEMNEQIATTSAALDKATQSGSHEHSTDVDPAWQQVRTNSIQDEIALKASQSHKEKLETQVAGFRRQLSTLQGYTAEFNNLQAKADELKDNYQLYTQKRDEAQMEDAMDAQNMTNVGVAQQPTISYIPEKPKIVIDLLLGGVTAFFMGLCAVYFADSGRRTVATPRELDQVSAYPVLATVPVMPGLDLPIIWSEMREQNESAT